MIKTAQRSGEGSELGNLRAVKYSFYDAGMDREQP
jgi:hypothetical protein